MLVGAIGWHGCCCMPLGACWEPLGAVVGFWVLLGVVGGRWGLLVGVRAVCGWPFGAVLGRLRMFGASGCHRRPEGGDKEPYRP